MNDERSVAKPPKGGKGDDLKNSLITTFYHKTKPNIVCNLVFKAYLCAKFQNNILQKKNINKKNYVK